MKPFQYIVALALSASTAAACDLRPDGGAILLTSAHVDAQYHYNEANPGLFLDWECRGLHTRAGAYRNSFYKPSVALTFAHDALTLSAGGFNAQPFAGVAHYPDTGRHEIVSINGSDWIAIGGLQFTHDALPMFLQLIPGDVKEGGYSHLWAAGLTWSF